VQAVILAGGKGVRLASRLNGRPKPLIEIGGRPLLQRQLDQLAAAGVEEAIVLVSHEAGQIEAFLGERSFGAMRVSVIDDGAPRGTGGAVLACLERLSPRCLVLYGDTLFDIDIAAFAAAHDRAGGDATLFLHPNDHPADSDLVELDDDGWITAFHGYPHPPEAWLPNLVNAAFYCVERAALAPYRGLEPPLDFAKNLFPRMLAEGARLHGYRSFEYIKDVGTPARVDKAERDLLSGAVARARRDRPQAAVFLDRDGVLNALCGHIRRPEDLVLIPGAAEAVRILNRQGLRAVVVTNQPVLARGECTPEGLRRIHAKLDAELGHEGAYLDALYVCPHHPHSGFPGEVAALKVDCECRKPKIGLILSAAAELNIDLAQSWMIGDCTSDLLAARRSGLRSILVRTGEGGRDGRCPAEPDFTADDLLAAVELIRQRRARASDDSFTPALETAP
jgi:histidinol-phosphate phosphatase family protein